MRRIILIIIAIGLLGSLGYYFYSKTKTKTTAPVNEQSGTLFPLGDPTIPTIEGSLATPDAVTSPDGSTSTASVSSAFKKLTRIPVAGYTFFVQKKEVTIPATTPKAKPQKQTILTPTLRYVARNTGYVYELKNDEPSLQISNIYIPYIYEAVFGDGGSTAIVRFLRPDQRTIATYSIPVPPENPDGTRSQKAGTYFADNITSIARSPDQTQLARLIPLDTLGGVVSISSLLNTKQVELYRSAFEEWLVAWPNQKTVYLQTKAAATAPGYLYRVDTTEKKLRRVLGDINGLTTVVSPTGTYVLYSQSTTNGFTTNLLNTKTNVVQNINLSILPEKCTWLQNEDLICAGNSTIPSALYPDDWYKGIVRFSDHIYRISSTNNTYQVLADSTEQSFDMTQLSVDEAQKKLFFVDKSTGILWQFSY